MVKKTRFNVFLASEEKNAISRAAQDDGRSMSGYMVHHSLKAAKKQIWVENVSKN